MKRSLSHKIVSLFFGAFAAYLCMGQGVEQNTSTPAGEAHDDGTLSRWLINSLVIIVLLILSHKLTEKIDKRNNN